MSNETTQILLAAKSTTLSAIRTSLSFIRTSAVCLSLALAVMKLEKKHPFDAYTIALLSIAGVFLVFAIITPIAMQKYLKNFGKKDKI